MNLFNEFYNSEAQCLLNLFSLNRPFTASEARELASEAHVYSLSGTCEEVIRRWEEQSLICARPDGTYTVGEELVSFVTPLNLLETECLSELCGADAAALFLTDELREKLSRILSSAPTEPPDAPLKRERESPPDIRRFQIILDAISRKRMLGYYYRTGYSRKERYAEVSPYRLEYNAWDGRWWMISYWEKENRSIKSRLDRLRAVHTLEQPAVGEARIRSVIARNLMPEPLILRIAGENVGKLRNVVERCFIGFETMQEAIAIKHSETEYELRFRYFHWDEKLIIRKILALGEYVTILSPGNMVTAAAAELRTALSRYGEAP